MNIDAYDYFQIRDAIHHDDTSDSRDARSGVLLMLYGFNAIIRTRDEWMVIHHECTGNTYHTFSTPTCGYVLPHNAPAVFGVKTAQEAYDKWAANARKNTNCNA